MPGTNAGTGQPISFSCSKCRKTTGPCRQWTSGGSLTRCSHRQLRTGRTRPAPQGNSGLRNLKDLHEYQCECGHVGWSRHVGVVRLLIKEATPLA